VFAPVYLLAGSLQARPPTTFMAMGITLTLPVLCELGAHYSGDFAVAANTAIALFLTAQLKPKLCVSASSRSQATACLQQMSHRASLSTNWLICTAR